MPQKMIEATFAHAIDWLRRNADRRFFLFLHTYEVHLPLQPERELLRLFEPSYDGLLPDVIGEGIARQINRGEIEITTHPSGSLFAGADIKRAIQTGQVPIGERLLSAHQNENAIFGIDSIPFLATTFDTSAKLWEAARPTYEKILDEQGEESTD